MGKKTNKIKVSFVGPSAEEVTGSMTLIESSNKTILLECGLYQSNSPLSDYKVNSRKLGFSPKKLDYIFIGHAHIDHIGLLPRLYAMGCTARIIVPKGLKKLFSIMGVDSAFIINREYELLSRKNSGLKPIYTKEDVEVCLQYFEEYEYGEKIQLDDEVEFRLQPAGHIINSAQIELWVKEKNQTKKILYTSDLGNTAVEKYYTQKFIPVDKANLVIGESTYAKQVRDINQRDRDKDLEKMEHIIKNTVSNRGKVLIPIFSLDRCQNILTHLYLIFKDCENFNAQIVIDSPLAIEICYAYKELLEGEELELWNEVLSWKKITFVKNFEHSKRLQMSAEPMVILAASGFMQAGRSRQWAKEIIPSRRSHIIFVGFSSENSLAGIIKEGQQAMIKIDDKTVRNRCAITDLKSFSGHMQQRELLEYYSTINCEKVALVHGNFKDKCNFAKILQEHIFRRNKTHKVISVNAGTTIAL